MAGSTIWAPVGDKGPDGDKGPPGDKGPVGDQGPPGIGAEDFAQFKIDLQNSTDTAKGVSFVGGALRVVDNIAALRALPNAGAPRAITLGYYLPGDNGGGLYYLDATDSTSIDNGGSVIISTAGARWKLQNKASATVRTFGAKGDNTANDTAAINNFATSLTTTGGIVQLSKGIFKVLGISSSQAAIPITLDGITGEPVSDVKRVTIQGRGADQTEFSNGGAADSFAVSITSVPGIAAHVHTTVGGWGATGGLNVKGLYLYNAAYLKAKDLSFWGLKTGLHLESVLSSGFDDIHCSNCITGIYGAKAAGFSGINALVFDRPVTRFCSQIGWNFPGPIVNLTINGGSTEACGTQAASGTGGMAFNFDGTEGGVGVNITGHYFEGNAGAWDVSLINSGSTPVTSVFESCNFNRVGNTSFTTNNIFATGPQRLIFIGCTFQHFGSYTPSSGRLYINVGAGVQVICIGCTFGSSIEQGTIRNINSSVPFNGNILNTGAASYLPPGWSSSKVGTGTYTITHNLGVPVTQCSLVATTNSGSAVRVQRAVIGNTNSFTIVTENTASALTDADFTFMFSIA